MRFGTMRIMKQNRNHQAAKAGQGVSESAIIFWLDQESSLPYQPKTVSLKLVAVSSGETSKLL